MEVMIIIRLVKRPKKASSDLAPIATCNRKKSGRRLSALEKESFQKEKKIVKTTYISDFLQNGKL